MRLLAPSNTFLLLLLPTLTNAVTGNQITWSAVILTLSGERTPSLSPSTTPNQLTPLGATQAHLAGSLVRSRYVAPPLNGSTLTDGAPLTGLSSIMIDNAQLEVLSSDEEEVAGSAVAFMQGLYPPMGAVQDAESRLANGSTIVGPLGGYQYPVVEVVGELDFRSVWVAGDSDCAMYAIDELNTLSSASYSEQIVNASGFYDSLLPTVFSPLSAPVVSYLNAYALYEYAAYQYTHNASVDISPADLSHLHYLAAQQLYLTNSPTTTSSTPAVAGKTLASKILSQFYSSIATTGSAPKLTLLFSNLSPLLSFFALSSLTTGPEYASFSGIPLSGSVAAFELFSYAPTTDGNMYNTSFPATTDLWVRFLFRNGTDDSESLTPYPLFNRGNSETDMSWTDFTTEMGKFAVEIADWCTECGSASLFCEAIALNEESAQGSGSEQKHGKHIGVSNVVAGVIGAVVTLGVGLLTAAVLLLFGFRFGRRGWAESAEAGAGVGVLQRSRGSGGFKGAEKLASDTDLRLKGQAGASVIRHERLGSWELGEGLGLDKEVEVGGGGGVDRRRSSEGDGDGEVGLGGAPVKAVEHV